MQYAPSLGLGIDTSAAARRLNPARNSSDEPRGERWPVFNRDGLVVDTKGGFDIDEADNSEDCDGADDDGGEVEGSQSYTDGCDERDEATGEYDETIRYARAVAKAQSTRHVVISCVEQQTRQRIQLLRQARADRSWSALPIPPCSLPQRTNRSESQ